MRYFFSSLVTVSLLLVTSGQANGSVNGQEPLTNSSDGKRPAPLSSVIGANADIRIEPNEVVLGKMHGLVVEVRNNTDRPLLFDGDHATATIGGSHYLATPVSSIRDAVTPDITRKEIIEADVKATVTATVTVGAVQAIEGIKTQAKPVLERYGPDEVRRQDEIGRFGKRIIWPGDNTKGIVYFATNRQLKGASIEIPVHSMFSPGDQASLTKSY